MWKAVILAAAWVRVAQTALPLPTYIKPCARSNPDFNACALRSARDSFPYAVKGDPSFRLLPLDPMQVEQVKVEVGGAGGLTVLMKNVHISGITDTKIEMTNFNFETRHIHHEATTPRLEVIGQYEVCGRVLQLPLSGSGNFNVTLVDTHLTYDVDYNLELIDGRRHLVPRNPETAVSPSRMHVKQIGLFKGNEMLDERTNEFLEENWKELLKELVPIMNTVFRDILFRFHTRFDSMVPFDVAFPEHLP
ncbi:protein takeout-like [Cryptotermes secundus]|uniref:protein takeout-like n=1 Tax=Cryptotermes secundus TaxID=105785 RepID=UPI000CD7D63A|nr:protein takeout-like [Cryptotermes secundus]